MKKAFIIIFGFFIAANIGYAESVRERLKRARAEESGRVSVQTTETPPMRREIFKDNLSKDCFDEQMYLTMKNLDAQLVGYTREHAFETRSDFEVSLQNLENTLKSVKETSQKYQQKRKQGIEDIAREKEKLEEYKRDYQQRRDHLDPEEVEYIDKRIENKTLDLLKVEEHSLQNYEKTKETLEQQAENLKARIVIVEEVLNCLDAS